MASMPMYFPANFALDTAVTCANLVNCAYDQYTQWYNQGTPDLSSFDWTPSLPDYKYSAILNWGYEYLSFGGWEWCYEPFGFVAWANDIAYVVFRGTVSDMDALYDAKIDQVAYAQVSGFGSVHLGYSEMYTQLSPQVLAALAQMKLEHTVNQIIFTGHSMGSGLSTLAVPDVVTNCTFSCDYLHINLASPRVGDPAFAKAMNALPLPTYRIVNTEDIVPTAPLATDDFAYYQHVGTPVDYTANYLSIDGNHSLTGSYLYALNNPGSPQDMSSITTSIRRPGGPTPIGQARDGHVGPAAMIAATRTKSRGPIPGNAPEPTR